MLEDSRGCYLSPLILHCWYTAELLGKCFNPVGSVRKRRSNTVFNLPIIIVQTVVGHSFKGPDLLCLCSFVLSNGCWSRSLRINNMLQRLSRCGSWHTVVLQRPFRWLDFEGTLGKGPFIHWIQTAQLWQSRLCQLPILYLRLKFQAADRKQQQQK